MKGLIGGVSEGGVTYNTVTDTIKVRGWLLPRCNYDTIEIWYNNELLGTATLDKKREDVIRKLPQFSDTNPGFEFKKSTINYSNDSYILLLIKCKNQIVETRIEKLQIVSYCNCILDMGDGANIKKLECSSSIVFLGEGDEDLPLVLKKLNFTSNKPNKVYTLQELKNLNQKERKFYIILSSSWSTFAHYLESKGYAPNVDFVPLWYLITQATNQLNLKYLKDIGLSCKELVEYVRYVKGSKQICIVYGNCQAAKIAEGLSSNSIVTKQYTMIVLPAIFEIDHEFLLGLREIINFADLFIYQYVKMNNKFHPVLGTEYILTALSDTCRKICIPNIYFTGYFPQMCTNLLDKHKLFPIGDKNINNLYSKKQLTEEQLSSLGDDEYYSKEEILKQVEESFNNLKDRECKCDVIISDFIENNYKKDLLFYTENHPTNIVLEEMSKRIISAITGKEDDYKVRISSALDDIQLPIYPSVQCHLGLKFNLDTICPNKKSGLGRLTFKEYIYQYIYSCCNDEKP